jgi:peroxiredoxin
MRNLVTAIFLFALSATASAQGTPRAAEFSTVNMNGTKVELKKMKGKVVLLTFWSTRCPICHSEIPKLNRMAASYAGKDVIFLAATAETEQQVNAYTRRNPFEFDILPNNSNLMLKYATRDSSGRYRMGFPAYFVIDRSGRVEMSAMGWNHVGRVDKTIDVLLARSE